MTVRIAPLAELLGSTWKFPVTGRTNEGLEALAVRRRLRTKLSPLLLPLWRLAPPSSVLVAVFRPPVHSFPPYPSRNAVCTRYWLPRLLSSDISGLLDTPDEAPWMDKNSGKTTKPSKPSKPK